MSRTFQDIQDAKATLTRKQTESAVQSYPPGFITGFKLSIDEFGQLVVGAGAANVAGRAVDRSDSYTISEGDWNDQRIYGMSSNLYLDPAGGFHVDSQEPTYSDQYFAYYHPSMTTWRNIGRLFVALSTGLILFCSMGDPDTYSGRTVVVAAKGYRGNADYYMDGDDDQVEANRALTYVYQKYGGGRVEITEGTANTTAAINIPQNCELHLRAGCTISKVGAFHGILAQGSFGAAISKAMLTGQGTVTRGTGDDATNSYVPVYFGYVNDAVISDITSDGSDASGIYVTECTRIAISNCVAKDAVYSGIYVNSGTGGGGRVIGCACTGNGDEGITIVSSDGTVVLNNLCSGNDGGIATVGSDGCLISSNRCESGTSKGINIDLNSVNNQIIGNSCYANGDDAAFGNVNSDNFFDAGTDTMTSGNSWE